MMGSVYIISENGKLSKQNDCLMFTCPDGTTRKLFLHRTHRMIIAGNVEITGSAMRILMHNRVDTVFLSANGKFNGKLQFEESRNVFLRKRQFDSLNEPEFCLSVARSIATGKLTNQINFMQRISRKVLDPDIPATLEQAKRNMSAVQEATSIDAVRGHEGYGSRLYFSVFKHDISPSWARFNGRSMNPPRDNVNAVLSFLYTLLMYRVDALIETEGLDPYVGYLHTLEYGKRSLTFDLMEEFRVPICDTVGAALFNLGILTKDDFHAVDFSAQNDDAPLCTEEVASEEDHPIATETVRGILLTKEGARKTALKFEEKLDSEILYPPTNTRLSYQKVIWSQIRRFKRLLTGEEAEYKPFLVR